MHPSVECYLGVAAEAVDTMYRMVGYAEIDYEETGFLDIDFSIWGTKELVGLARVPMKSRISGMVL